MAPFKNARTLFLLSVFGFSAPLSVMAAWSVQRPDGSGPYGYWTTIALDSSNNPQMAFRDGSSGGNLRYLRWTGVTWAKETVDTGFDNNGGHCSIALTSEGAPRISYFKTGFGLRFATKTGSWTSTTIDSTGGQYTSLKIDLSGQVHISYFASNSLKYAKWDGIRWTTTTIDGGGVVGMWTSLALDSDGNPFISYYDSTNGDLKMAQWSGTAWSTQTVVSAGTVGNYTSIKLDSINHPFISFIAGTSVKLAHWDGSSWVIETVATTGAAYTSLAFDIYGNPVLSYKANNNSLRLASRSGSVWSESVVDPSYGDFPSLAIGSDGTAHIAYGSIFFNYAKNDSNSPPTNIVVSSRTLDSITWSWTDNSTAETGFRILRAGDLSSISEDLPANTTGWIQTGLPPNTSSQIVVRALFGPSHRDSTTSTVRYSLAAPPLSTTLIFSSGTSVNLEWSANGNSPGTSFSVERSSGAGFSFIYLGTTTRHTANLIEESTTSFRVRALNGEGIPTAFDNVVSRYLPPSVPVSPGTPDLIGRSTDTISWTWTDNSIKEVGYRVLRAEDLTPISEVLPANTVNWTQTGLTPNATSQIIVQAFNAIGEANSIASQKRYSLAVPPSNTHVVSSSGTSMILAWEENGNPAQTIYNLEKSDNGIHFTQISSGTSTLFQANNLSDGATTFFRVNASNGDLIPTIYDNVIAAYLPVATQPGEPRDLSVKNRTTNSLTWQWKYDSQKEDGFRVLRASDAFVLATLPADTTYWVQAGMEINSKSQIQIEAFNAFGAARTNLYYDFWEEFTFANPPAGTFISSVTATTIALSWSSNGNSAETYYTGYISSDGTHFSEFDDYTRQPPMVATGLESEKRYYFKITAKNGGFVETLPDIVVSTVTPLGPPGVPVPHEFDPLFNGIHWEWENQPNADGYKVYSRGGDLLASLPAGQNNWIQGGLETYETSSIQVEAFNQYGSTRSPFGYGVSLANAPTDLDVTDVSRTSVSLAWSDSGNPKSVYYRIQHTSSTFSSYSSYDTTNYAWDGATSTVIHGLTPGVTYYFRVSAANNTVFFSPVVSTVTSLGMDAPTVDERTTDSLVWKWTDDVAGETHYRILDGATGADLSGPLPADTTRWPQIGLAPNTFYQVILRAEGAFGISESPMSQKCFTSPMAPTNLRLVGLASDKISLAWDSGGNPSGTTYVVLDEYTDEVIGHKYYEEVEKVEGTSVTLRGLYPGTTFRLFVVARGQDETTEISEDDKPLVVTTLTTPFRFYTENPSWVIETVDSGPESGEYSSVAINSLNVPYIYYGAGENGDLKVASLSSSGWGNNVIVEGAQVGSRPSAVFTQDDEIVLAYHDRQKGRLKLMSDLWGRWTTETLPMDKLTAGEGSVSFNGQGFQGTSMSLIGHKPVIAYTSYLPPTSKSLGIYTISKTTMLDLPFAGAMASVDEPVDIKNDWQTFHLLTKPVEKTSSGESSSGVGDVQVALDSNGGSHFVYFHANDRDLFPTATGDILYAHMQGDLFSTETIEPGIATEFSSIDIKLDSQDRVHVVYADTINEKVRHAIKTESGWSIETIDERKPFGFIALALDKKGNPHVAYTDVDKGDLYYASQQGGAWHVQLLEGGDDLTGWNPSIAVDSLGAVHIAFQDKTHETLRHAGLMPFTLEVKRTVGVSGGRFELSGSHGPVKLNVLPGTFSREVTLSLSAPTLFPVTDSVATKLKPLGIGLEILADPYEKPSHPVIVTLSYNESLLPERSENRLTLAYFDSAKGEWVPVSTNIDSTNNQLTATIPDIAILQVMLRDTSLPPGEIRAYPNPLRPSTGQVFMTFGNLLTGVHVKIFTLRGELVREFTEDGTGSVLWDGRNANGQSVASGIYFVRIDGAGVDKTLKVAVQR